MSDIETIIDDKSDKIAVIELSTRAVKLLVGNDPDALRRGMFNFKYFNRQSTRTDTGRGLTDEGYMDLDYFCDNVLPAIVNARRSALQMHCGKIYTVATAAYRNARNRDELLATIRREAGLNVEILSRHDEAMGSIMAYQFTTSNRAEFFRHQHHVMVDQGGASTEVSLFNAGESVLDVSLDLGTETLKAQLMKQIGEGHSLLRALRMAREHTESQSRQLMSSLPESVPDALCIAVGSAITGATGLIGSAAYHDKVMTLGEIEEALEHATDRLTSRFANSADLAQATDRRTDALLTQAVGLPFYIMLLRRLGLSQLTVSGTGLWYGIYYRYLLGI